MMVKESVPILGGTSQQNGNGYGSQSPVLQAGQCDDADSKQQMTDKLSKIEQEQRSDVSEGGSSFWNLTSTKKWTFVLLCVANVAYCASYSILGPFFPSQAVSKGMSVSAIGLVFSSYELCLVLACPVFGNYLVQIGPRFAFIAGQFMAGGCSVLFGTLYMAPAGVPFTVLTFLLRSMMALGAAAFCTASFAMAAQQFPDHRSMVLAGLEICSGAGFMVGPPLGGALYELGGFGLPFYSMGVFLIVYSMINYFCLSISTDSLQKQVQRGSVLSLLASPLIVVVCITLISGTYTFGFVSAALAFHLHTFHVPVAISGLYFVILSVCYSLFALLVGWLSANKNLSYTLMIIGCILITLSMLLIGPSPLLPFLKADLGLVAFALVLTGVGAAGIIIPVFRCFYIGARRLGFKDGLELEGVLSGLFTSSFHFGVFLGPTVGSPVMQAANYKWSATLNAGFVFLSLTLLILYKVVEKVCLQYDDTDICTAKSPQDTQQSVPPPCQISSTDKVINSPAFTMNSEETGF